MHHPNPGGSSARHDLDGEPSELLDSIAPEVGVATKNFAVVWNQRYLLLKSQDFSFFVDLNLKIEVVYKWLICVI